MTIISELLGRGATARRVLDLLISAPGREIHTREIARRVQLGFHVAVEGQVDVDLAVAVAVQRADRGVRLAADRLHLVADELVRRESRVAQLLSDRLADMRGVRFGLIFGSFASGADDVTSDIDVLLVGDVNWDRLAKLGDAISDHVRREVNFVVWSEDELRQPKRGQRRLLESILSNPRIPVKGSDNEFIASARGMAAEVRDRHHAGSKRLESGAKEARRGERSRR